jgi:hypothetical protein
MSASTTVNPVILTDAGSLAGFIQATVYAVVTEVPEAFDLVFDSSIPVSNAVRDRRIDAAAQFRGDVTHPPPDRPVLITVVGGVPLVGVDLADAKSAYIKDCKIFQIAEARRTNANKVAAAAIGIILSRLSSEITQRCLSLPGWSDAIGTNDLCAVWNLVKSSLDTEHAAKRMSAHIVHVKFLCLQQTGDFSNYFEQFQILRTEVTRLGLTLQEQLDLAAHFVSGLDNRYQTFKSIYGSANPEFDTWDKVITAARNWPVDSFTQTAAVAKVDEKLRAPQRKPTQKEYDAFVPDLTYNAYGGGKWETLEGWKQDKVHKVRRAAKTERKKKKQSDTKVANESESQKVFSVADVDCSRSEDSD